MSEPPKNASSAEPRTVPPSPGHITQLGTSEVPWENMFPDIPKRTKLKKRRVFILINLLKLYRNAIRVLN